MRPSKASAEDRIPFVATFATRIVLAEIPVRTLPPRRTQTNAGLRLLRGLRPQRPSVAEPDLHRVAAGEPGAVQECLGRYGGLVRSLCRRFCPNRKEAEDAVQEVFIEIWNQAKRYDAGLSSEITFVAMVARRRLIDRGRRRQRALPTEGIEDERAFTASEDRSRQMVDIGCEVERAQKALSELLPDEEKVLRLSICAGMSYEQIAKATALPLGAVKSHLRRGRDRGDPGLHPRSRSRRTRSTSPWNSSARWTARPTTWCCPGSRRRIRTGTT